MGLFSSNKKSSTSGNQDWVELQSTEGLDDLENHSMDQPIVIFKHSTRCSISHFVHRRLASDWNFKKEELPFYYLDLIQFRNLSNAIADRTGVKHESPQMILWYKGKVLYNASHDNINLNEMQKHLPLKPN
ncbi:MAG TPA: bacillithiol system redox-active protein YtxJ [Saprospiraceae bacterium]|nr:bacillithiol system redox-active protein YtxJ [Saprospiraceae bacterium]